MNGNGDETVSRLDRIEGIIEALVGRHAEFENDLAQLLKAQILMNDQLQRLTGEVRALAEAQRHTDDRLNALITVVDDLVRRPPQ